jgi:hypothetical protein
MPLLDEAAVDEALNDDDAAPPSPEPPAPDELCSTAADVAQAPANTTRASRPSELRDQGML